VRRLAGWVVVRAPERVPARAQAVAEPARLQLPKAARAALPLSFAARQAQRAARQ
jgi:hypothetical protein